MIYHILRPLLFQLAPERAHRITLQCLQLAYHLKLTKLFSQPQAPRRVMGLDFPNPVGLSAGFDVNADYVDALASLGFGFIEIGGVTPKPQIGNPKPRLFRLIPEQALINRMGFYNKGVDYVAGRLAKMKYRGILGINITKNRETPLETAVDDYLYAMHQLWRYASYFTINVSSPNTPGLRDLLQKDRLATLLTELKQAQQTLHMTQQKYVPLVVKLSPDLEDEQLTEVATVLLACKIDGVIATNTSINHEAVVNSPYAKEVGGLSGLPLHRRSTAVIRKFSQLVKHQIPIIASGGVMNEATAKEKISAGASLLQVYTGLVYNGIGLLPKLVRACR